jgi:hypothetical protein
MHYEKQRLCSRSIFVRGALVVAVLGGAALACGKGTGGEVATSGPPASTGNTPPYVPPTFPTAPPPGAPACGPVAPAAGSVRGKLLSQDDVFRLVGVTTDGFAVFVHYYRPAESPADCRSSVVAIDSRTLKTFDLGVAEGAIVHGKVVGLWPKLYAPYGTGRGFLWSAATGLHDSGGESGGFWSNADGASVAVWTLADMKMGATGLATPLQSVFTAGIGTVGADGKLHYCVPHAAFIGSRFFASSCDPQQAAATVRVVSDTLQVTTVLANAANDWSADTLGTKIFVRDIDGIAEIHTIPQNQVTAVDTGVTSGVMASDGSAVAYTTSAGELKHASTSTPAGPVVLVPSGARELLGASPDFAQVVVASNPPDKQNTSIDRHDLGLASALTPGIMTPLVATSTGELVGFTDVGGFVLFRSDIASTGFHPPGVLHARAGLSGADAVVAAVVRRVMPVPGSAKVVYGVPYPPTSNGSSDPRSDLWFVDLAASGPSKRLVQGAVEEDVVVTASELYFVVQGGLYVMPIP